jgi:hypothetical protein
MDTDAIGGFNEPAFRSLGHSACPGQNAQQQNIQYESHVFPLSGAAAKKRPT